MKGNSIIQLDIITKFLLINFSRFLRFPVFSYYKSSFFFRYLLFLWLCLTPSARLFAVPFLYNAEITSSLKFLFKFQNVPSSSLMQLGPIPVVAWDRGNGRRSVTFQFLEEPSSGSDGYYTPCIHQPCHRSHCTLNSVRFLVSNFVSSFASNTTSMNYSGFSGKTCAALQFLSRIFLFFPF